MRVGVIHFRFWLHSNTAMYPARNHLLMPRKKRTKLRQPVQMPSMCITHSHTSTRRHTMDQGSFEGVGGLKIFTRSWHPTQRQPRAVVVIVHGFNSHSGHYLWVGEQFSANGLAVHALDL